MRNKLHKFMLALVAVAFSSPMLAGNWSLPTPRIQAELVKNDTVYLYNVEQGQFLAAGGAWGTHAALQGEGFPYVLTEVEGTPGAYTLFSSAAKASSQQLLARENVRDVYTDYAGRDGWCPNWSFINGTKAGYYRMTSPEGDANYGTEENEGYGFQFGWDPNSEDLTNGNGASMGTNISVYMMDPETEGAALDWAFVTKTDYAIYFVRFELYNMLNKAEENGVSTTDAEKVYAKADATSDEIKAACVALQELITAKNAGGLESATEDNPVDATSFIVNPNFDGKSGNGWTYSGFEPKNNKVWTGEGVTCDNFMEIWDGSPVGNASLKQAVASLPAGHYVLGLDGLACRQGQDKLEVSGVTIYAEGATRAEKKMFTYTATPEHFELDIIHNGGDMIIGVDVVSTDANFVLVDNFTLTYYGKTSISPYVLAMNTAARQLEPYADEEAYIYSNATLKQVNDVLGQVENFAGSDEQADALTGKINELYETVKSEVKAYAALNELIEKCEKDMKKFESIADLPDGISDLKQKYQDAYNDRTYSIEDINKAKEEYTTYVVAQVKVAMTKATAENPVDITALYDNMGYENNTKDEWNCNADWKVRAHVAEVYQSTFKLSRTISDLPAGKYIVKVKGFYRHGGSTEDYQGSLDETNEMNAYLFANGKQNELAPYTNGIASEKYDGYTEVAQGKYCPNSMESSEIAFNLDDRYQVAVETGVVNEGGDLTFGVMVENAGPGGYWTCWSQFQLVYCGADNSIVFDALETLLEEAYQVDEECAQLVDEAAKKLEDAMSYAANVIDEKDTENASKAYNDLAEAIEFAKPIPVLFNKLIDYQQLYMSLYEIYCEEIGADEAFEELLEEMSEYVEEEHAETMAQITDLVKNASAAWTQYIQKGKMADASAQNPADISLAILNNTFVDPLDEGEVNANYWSVSQQHDGGGQRQTSQCFEYWNFDKFDMNQTVCGLAEGKYRLECQAMYRPTNSASEAAAEYNADPTQNLRALLYVANGKDELTAPITHICAGASDEEFEGDSKVTLNGESKYIPNSMNACRAHFDAGLYPKTVIEFEVKKGENITLGVKKQNGVGGDWFLVDAFNLYYMGADGQTAVENISATQNASTGIYDLSGRKLNRMNRGLNIMKFHNGDSKVVVVK